MKALAPALPSGSRAKPASDSAVLYSTLSSSDPELAPTPPADETAREGREPSEPPDARWARFQRNRDDFLLHTLAPRARDCWKKIEGEGRIEFLYLMRHESGHGVGRITPTTDIGVETPVSIVESELSPEQSKQALDCMLDAIEGTSFTSELPTPGETLVGMYQGWHVGKGLAKE
ncbi:MAG TPA: hypothetical protein VM261_37120 [Kofleriaceae bacterium]|nr:hypothetical protein [Kofleriaceae bacterium]